MFFSACLTWPAMSTLLKWPSTSQPTCPAMKICRPETAMPLLSPRGRGHCVGCRICGLAGLSLLAPVSDDFVFRLGGKDLILRG